MLQETAGRLAPLVRRSNVFAVVGRAHAAAVRRQLPWLARRNLLVEPVGRNTLPAIALAALTLARRDPGAVMAVLPADHAIPDGAAFRSDLGRAFDLALDTGALVTFGIVPTRPETGYGYIAPGVAVSPHDDRALWVARFVEKPDRARAEAMVAEGHLWNGGIFVWRVGAILEALRAYAADVLSTLERALERGTAAALTRAYGRIPSVSIDTGVMEQAPRVAVVRAGFAWNDVGSWAALADLWPATADGNVTRGAVVAVDSRGCVVDSPQRLVALLGVEDLVVVDADDAILVCRKDRAQDVRRVVDALGRDRLRRYR